MYIQYVAEVERYEIRNQTDYISRTNQEVLADLLYIQLAD